jgi:hypothetical protein
LTAEGCHTQPRKFQFKQKGRQTAITITCLDGQHCPMIPYLSFFLLFYSLNGLNMTYITIFYDFFYTVTNDKITERRQLSKLKTQRHEKKNNNTIDNKLEY